MVAELAPVDAMRPSTTAALQRLPFFCVFFLKRELAESLDLVQVSRVLFAIQGKELFTDHLSSSNTRERRTLFMWERLWHVRVSSPRSEDEEHS